MKIILSIIFISLISQLYSEAYLSGIFRDKMILQRDKDIKVWGYGDQGDEVIVRICDQEKSTIVDDNDRWSVVFQPLKISKVPVLFELESEGIILNLEDVLIGDVWFCSGQSNMVLSTSFATNGQDVISRSENPCIRLFTVTQSYELQLNDEPEILDTWEYCSPVNVKDFSATAYFFGKELNENLDIPIGLINSSYGSSMIESWTSMEGNIKVEGGKQYIEDVYNHQYSDLEERHYPSAIFNTMIFPFTEFAIKGFIWYQGERNTRTDGACYKYRFQLPVLINDWRSNWNEETLPFYFVQLPNYKIDYNWALMRESMKFAAENTVNTGIAITIDIGESDNIHPANKQEVGRRLSLLALKNTYSKKIIDSGPVYRDHTVKNEQITVDLVNTYDGLKFIGDDITGFEIASVNRIFYDAEAYLEGGNIILSSEYVNNPVAVRYGWSSDPKCNVYNSEDLPLSPFRTDDWPLKNSGY
ncbi:MAG: hypothetical protein JXR69_08520 [Candidatus Delongbacteria bacterium]|nr:hypothetical protein [Candidatus Delongbacteria bacterium]